MISGAVIFLVGFVLGAIFTPWYATKPIKKTKKIVTSRKASVIDMDPPVDLGK